MKESKPSAFVCGECGVVYKAKLTNCPKCGAKSYHD
jgi:rubrerythrin